MNYNDDISVLENIKTGKAKEKKVISKMYELNNLKNSDFVKEGTENTINPLHLNSPATLTLALKATVVIPKVGKRRIQYLPSAPTLFVDDYKDENGVDQKGLISLKWDLNEGYRAARQMNISFKQGILNMMDYGDDPMLVEFLEIHPHNLKSRYFSHSTASPIFAFKPLIKEEKAKIKIEPIEIEHAAIGLILALRQKTGKVFTYDTERIDAYLRLLSIGEGIAEAINEDKINLLVAYAKKNPAYLITTIEDGMSKYLMQMAGAVTAKVLIYDTKDARFKDEKKPFFVFAKDSANTAEDQLAFYFISDEGQKTFNDMILKKNTANAESLK